MYLTRFLMCAAVCWTAASAWSAKKDPARRAREAVTAQLPLCDFMRNAEAEDGFYPLDAQRFSSVSETDDFAAHATSVMLDDDKTILAFWDTQEGGPCGPAALSADAGRTWTDISSRIPEAFSGAHDTPFAYRFADPKGGKARIRVFAGYGTATEDDWRGPNARPLAEAMPSIVSEDDGKTWKTLPPLGADFACVTAFSGVERLKDGSCLAVFSRGRHPNGEGGPYAVMSSRSRDGGLTWEKPQAVGTTTNGTNLTLPTVFRSPDGKELCCLASVNWGGEPPVMCFSRDEGRTWSAFESAPDALKEERQVASVLADGNVLVVCRQGAMLGGWVGPYKSIRDGLGEGGVLLNLVHNYGGSGCGGYSGVHVRKDGEVVVVASSQANPRRPVPGVFAMRFHPSEIKARCESRGQALENFDEWDPFAGTSFKPLTAAKLYGPFAQKLMKKIIVGLGRLVPFDGTPKYIQRAVGEQFVEMKSKRGAFQVADFAKDRRGDAAICVWSVRVPKACTAKLRLACSPMGWCCFEGKTVLPNAKATVLEPRTVELKLQEGDNDIAVLLQQPQDRASADSGLSTAPMRVAVGLEAADFTCLDPGRDLELDADDAKIEIGDEL